MIITTLLHYDDYNLKNDCIENRRGLGLPTKLIPLFTNQPSLSLELYAYYK